ncbi:MAG: hypothetical protein K0S74_213 [Chlamydiales bacterium]|jgi:hypothetical protein|nr:hypothetical protein [Chlamydiales bacterium]
MDRERYITPEDILPKRKAYKYINLSAQLEREFVSKINNFFPVSYGGGGGSMMHDIKEVEFRLLMSSLCDVETARGIYLTYLNTFLELFNNNEKIRPYLANYPLTLANVEIRLEFYDANQRLVSDGTHICCIFNNNKYIYYDTKKGYGIHNPLKNIHKETYEEARTKEFNHLKLALGDKS